jgi:hypothetical protein
MSYSVRLRNKESKRLTRPRLDDFSHDHTITRFFFSQKEQTRSIQFRLRVTKHDISSRFLLVLLYHILHGLATRSRNVSTNAFTQHFLLSSQYYIGHITLGLAPLADAATGLVRHDQEPHPERHSTENGHRLAVLCQTADDFISDLTILRESTIFYTITRWD